MKPGQQTSILYIPFTNKVQYGHAVNAPFVYAISRYLYDPIGNTTQDLVSGQDTIQWNLYNKVIRTVNNTDTSSMKFIYDGAGNRVGKMYIKKAATGARSQKDDYYVRDAQGNILTIYHLTESFGIHGALQQQAFSLAEHDIYGSSRLGIKEYYGLQVGGSIDFTTGTYDTMRLFNKPPWYSLEYQDDIRPDSVNLYGNAFTDMYFAQHILGQKQYEVTDHLGDVMATVSDKRAGGTFATLGGGSLTAGSLATISTWKSEVISAHDYYPFGEYMPGRYMTDTSSNCVTTTISSIALSTYNVSVLWADLYTAGQLTQVTPLTVSLIIGGGGTVLDMGTLGHHGITYDIPIIAAGASQIDVGVNASVGAYTILVTDNTTSVTVGNLAISAGLGGTYSVSLLPHSTHLTIFVKGTGLTGAIALTTLSVLHDTSITHSIVTTVCNKDFYRYGYNGQLKDNEWAGLGNHYEYRHRGYNPQTGRFNTPDPVGQHFPWNGSYNYAENRVIDGIDLEGLEVMIVNEKSDQTIYDVGVKNTGRQEIDVYAHGTPFWIGNNEPQNSGQRVSISNPEQFDAYMSAKSAQWKNRQKNGETVVVLHSCRTGRTVVDANTGGTSPSIGQKISSQFHITVIAPDERDNFNSGGEIGPLVDEGQDINGNHPDGQHHKSTNQKGNWNVYKDGKLIESYKAGWTPKAHATWWDKLRYGNDIKDAPKTDTKPDTQPAGNEGKEEGKN